MPSIALTGSCMHSSKIGESHGTFCMRQQWIRSQFERAFRSLMHLIVSCARRRLPMEMVKCGAAPAAMLSSRVALGGGHVERLGAIRLPWIRCARSVGVTRASHKPEEESSVNKFKVLVALVAAGASVTLNIAAPVWSAHAVIPFRADVERNATATQLRGNEETCAKVGDTSCLRGNRRNQVGDNSTVRQGGEGKSLDQKELVSSEEGQQVKDAAGDVARGAAQIVATKAAQDFATTQLGVPGVVASAATQLVTKVVTK